jgi:hypothetical protein
VTPQEVSGCVRCVRFGQPDTPDTASHQRECQVKLFAQNTLHSPDTRKVVLQTYVIVADPSTRDPYYRPAIDSRTALLS